MRERLISTTTLWRWIGASTVLVPGAFTLREGNFGKDTLVVFLLGAALIGWEIYARLTRKTLVLRPGKVEVFQRGVLVGSFDPAQARYRGWMSKIRPLIFGIILSGLPLLECYAVGWPRTGVLVGLISIAAIFHDFFTHWTIESPKWGGRDWNLKVDEVKKTMTVDSGVDVGRWTLSPEKADIIAVLGFWPGDHLDSQTLQYVSLLGPAFLILAVASLVFDIQYEMHEYWLSAILGCVGVWLLTVWAKFRKR